MGRKRSRKRKGEFERRRGTRGEKDKDVPSFAGAKKDDTSHFCPPSTFKPSTLNLPPATFISLLLLYHSALNYFASH
jgi:hypothetical protein